MQSRTVAGTVILTGLLGVSWVSAEAARLKRGAGAAAGRVAARENMARLNRGPSDVGASPGGWEAKRHEVRRRLPRESFASPADGASQNQCRDFSRAAAGTMVSAAGDGAEYVVETDGVEIALDRILGTSAGGYLAFGAWSGGTLRAWFHPADNRWVIIGPSGVRATLGGDPEHRLGTDVAVAAGTFVWTLSRVEDANGNSVEPRSAP